MRIRSTIVAALLAVILALSSDAAYAEIANGAYQFDFSGIVSLWDISGNYSGGIGPFTLDFSINEEPSGKLTGSGTFNVDGLEGNITSFSGSMKGSSADPHVEMNMRMSGTGNLQGVNAKVSLAANMHYKLNSADHGLEHPAGSGTVTIKDLSNGKSVSQSGTFRHSALTPLGLPIDSTGDWGLSLTLTPNGNELAGTATVETSTAATADFTVTGTYDSVTDTSKIALKGDAGKLNLVISTSGTTLNVDSAEGKIFGQTVKFPGQ